jgi:tRNA-(ms[2]io[6]A)-hydroxylase
MFITLARKYYGRDKVDQMWEGLLQFEAEVIAKLGTSERIHG